MGLIVRALDRSRQHVHCICCYLLWVHIAIASYVTVTCESSKGSCTGVRMYLHSSSRRDMDACLHSVAAQNVSMAALSTLLHSHLKNQNVLINPLSQRMVLLNVLCNKVLLPVDATCCLPRDSRSPAVVLSILILLICG